MKNQFIQEFFELFEDLLEDHDKRMQDLYLEKLSKTLAQAQLTAESEFITIDETAKILKLSKPTVHGLRKAGKITAHRINKRIRYNRKEILEFVESGRD